MPTSRMMIKGEWFNVWPCAECNKVIVRKGPIGDKDLCDKCAGRKFDLVGMASEKKEGDE